MANQWFRFYAEFSSDPKVQMMPETFQRRLMMLFCFRCNGNETLHDEEIVFQLRVTPEEWQLTKAEFIARKFIDSSNRILNWDKRQFVSDSSKERVSRHREKKKQERNVTVTPPEQNRTEQIQNITEKKKTPKPPRGAFEDWWKLYPHKIGKGAAEKAYSKAIWLTDEFNLFEGLKEYIRTKPPDRAWCNPATWLNQERWKDEPNETTGKNYKRSKSKSERADDILAEYLAGLPASGGSGADSGNATPMLRSVQPVRQGSGSPEEHSSSLRDSSGSISDRENSGSVQGMAANQVNDANSRGHCGDPEMGAASTLECA